MSERMCPRCKRIGCVTEVVTEEIEIPAVSPGNQPAPPTSPLEGCVGAAGKEHDVTGELRSYSPPINDPKVEQPSEKKPAKPGPVWR